MPTYEYECDACGHTFDRFQGITQPALRKCPECGRLKLRRLIGAGSGVIFKGSGFYQTDYRSKEYHESAKKEKESTSKSPSKPEAKDGSKKSDSSKKKAD